MDREEKKLLKWSGICAVITTLIILIFILLISSAYAQTHTGYVPFDPKFVPPKHLGEYSRVFRTLITEVGTDGSFYLAVGTPTVTGSGTTGRVGTSTARDGSTCAMLGWDGARWVMKLPGTTTVTVIGSVLPGSLSAYVLANGGTLNNGTLADGSLAGTTTLPGGSQISANSRVLSPTEISYLDGLTDFITTLLTAKEDDANKGAASGYASLDANTKVVENPASGTSTPGVSKIPISEGTGYISDGWINPNARVGSTSVSAHNDVDFPTTPGNNQVLMYNFSTSQWENNTSSASVNWGAIGGSPNDQLDTLMSQAEAEGGTTTTSRMPSALRLKQAAVQHIAQYQGTHTPNLLEVYIGTTTAKKGAQIAGSRIASEGDIDSNTVLLLHADNPGTSTFVDSALTPKTITANGGAIGTTTVKFGSGSAYFDGTGDYLTAPDSADWLLTNTFTIDLWARITVNNLQGFVGQGVDANNYWAYFINSNTLRLQIATGGTDIVNVSASWTPSVNTWYHLALVNNGGTHTFYVNGTKVGTDQYDADVVPDYAATLLIGKHPNSADVMDGYFDEVRISKGVARWTGNFTAPVSAYIQTNYNDTVSFTDVAGDGSVNISVLIGSTTSTTARNFELASGQTSLADSWDTRCDPNLKEVISKDPLLADQAYDQLKLAEIKRWKFKKGGHEVTGVMIDDPNIPEDIIWRLEDGNPGGFSGTGFLNFLYSAIKSLITKTEQQKMKIETLEAIINPK